MVRRRHGNSKDKSERRLEDHESQYPEEERKILDKDRLLKNPQLNAQHDDPDKEILGEQIVERDEDIETLRQELLAEAAEDALVKRVTKTTKELFPRIERFEASRPGDYKRRMVLRPRFLIEQNAWILALRDNKDMEDNIPVAFKENPMHYLTLGLMEYLDEMYEASILAEHPDEQGIDEGHLWFMPKILPQQLPTVHPLSDEEIEILYDMVMEEREVAASRTNCDDKWLEVAKLKRKRLRKYKQMFDEKTKEKSKKQSLYAKKHARKKAAEERKAKGGKG